jgi:hypothetical protein
MLKDSRLELRCVVNNVGHQSNPFLIVDIGTTIPNLLPVFPDPHGVGTTTSEASLDVVLDVFAPGQERCPVPYTKFAILNARVVQIGGGVDQEMEHTYSSIRLDETCSNLHMLIN